MVVLLLALSPALVYAEKAPPPGRFDPRVRTVAYNPQDLVVVTTYYGVSTPIRFADDEAIEPESLDAGDRAAWSIKASARRNILFVRPVKPMADTNLTVVTNKRVYLLLLKVLDERAGRGGKGRAAPKAGGFAPTYSMAAAQSKNLTLSLTFTYPDEDARRAAAQAAQATRARTAAALRERMASVRAHARNTDYWVAGDDAIKPGDARDDGRFIYVTFAGNRDLPAFFAADDQGHESSLNVAVEGNTVIVDRMVRHLVLRRGSGPGALVACLVNHAFNPDGGAASSSGTVAPDVLRVIKGAEQ